jgi:lipopolysaccharide biosynthesis glycosyltransferase
MLKLFIGFDQVEAVAYHTMVQSIIDTCSMPVSITPIKMSMLPEYTRERDPKQSNEFSFTRFLVPHLCNYEGFGIFMDCDMLIRSDLKELWELRDPTKSIQVVKHDYTPKNQTKFLGATQYVYPRKNWSSVMLFNCAHPHCKRLSPKYVNTTEAMNLHRMYWTTVGGPWFYEYDGCEFSDEWHEKLADMAHCDQLSVRAIKKAWL